MVKTDKIFDNGKRTDLTIRIPIESTGWGGTIYVSLINIWSDFGLTLWTSPLQVFVDEIIETLLEHPAGLLFKITQRLSNSLLHLLNDRFKSDKDAFRLRKNLELGWFNLLKWFTSKGLENSLKSALLIFEINSLFSDCLRPFYNAHIQTGLI